MLDRLYCPDFSAVFGPEFRNPYDYPMIDALVWPSLIDLDQTPESAKLYSLVKDNPYPLFYRRKITINQFIIEMKASNLSGACLQAIDLGREYGIKSEIVLKAAKKYPGLFYPILSPQATKNGVDEFKTQVKRAVAVVIYPSYQKLDLLRPSPDFEQICNICTKEELPLKLDLGNMYLPENDISMCTVEKVRAFASSHSHLKIILSGLDLLGNGPQMLNLLRYEPNLYVEFDPRTFGGMTPKQFFERIFAIPGLIQNTWSRILLGSATPMLESSQLTRGWWDATATLPFASQSLLRTWLYRNIHRVYRLGITPDKSIQNVNEAPYAELNPGKIIEKSDHELFIQQDLELNSFSITQLLYISPHILDAAKFWTQKYVDYPYGELTLKSYHTTTSLIVNEHEIGNYLQMHYQFAEETMAKAEDKLHTLAAEENRADFNYPDHILATTVGDKDFTVPILDGKIQLGTRENLYVLVPFGPRGIKLSLTFKLFKGKKIEN
jgi:thiamine phosphate synthase YjbQ (UPF0047 family)